MFYQMGILWHFFEKDETAGHEIAASKDGTCGELAENVVITFAKSCSTTEEFITNLSAVSDQEIVKNENEAIGQSVNSAWLMQRKGRITASNFYAVYTKVNSSKSETVTSKCLNAEPLIKRLMGYGRINLDLPSLKHGRSFESVARAEYLATVKYQHQQLIFREYGLFIIFTQKRHTWVPLQMV